MLRMLFRHARPLDAYLWGTVKANINAGISPWRAADRFGLSLRQARAIRRSSSPIGLVTVAAPPDGLATTNHPERK